MSSCVLVTITIAELGIPVDEVTVVVIVRVTNTIELNCSAEAAVVCLRPFQD